MRFFHFFAELEKFAGHGAASPPHAELEGDPLASRPRESFSVGALPEPQHARPVLVVPPHREPRLHRAVSA